jgi:3-oxoacyl-[acyl-carrier-protein] synthase II
MERVVVTGLGVVSCIGNDVAAFWHSLRSGTSGIARIAAFDPAALSTQIAGEVKQFTFDAKLGKRMERFSQFAVAAARQALHQAGLLPEATGAGSVNPERIGVSVGTGIGGEPFLELQHAKFLERGPGRFHPLTVPIVIANMAAANISIHYKLLGPNLCISTACATGNHNIGTALDLIRLGRADAMVAGGTESTMTAFSLDGYAQLRALSSRNDDPPGASRPFSLGRDGFVLAEGAGVLLLESLTHAKRRGAEILAEVAGFGMTSDGYHLTAPHPDAKGAAQAMRLALADARLNPEDVSYVNAHGTSTPLNDALETKAIKAALGGRASQVPVSSIKSMIGHSLGAAAGIEAVACVLAIQHGVIPPTINLREPDPELDLDYVPNQAREAPLAAVLSNAFAFGGHNAVVAFKRFEG